MQLLVPQRCPRERAVELTAYPGLRGSLGSTHYAPLCVLPRSLPHHSANNLLLPTQIIESMAQRCAMAADLQRAQQQQRQQAWQDRTADGTAAARAQRRSRRRPRSTRASGGAAGTGGGPHAHNDDDRAGNDSDEGDASAARPTEPRERGSSSGQEEEEGDEGEDELAALDGESSGDERGGGILGERPGGAAAWLAKSREKTAEVLRQRKQLKKRMALAATRFNTDKKGWVQYAQVRQWRKQAATSTLFHSLTPSCSLPGVGALA